MKRITEFLRIYRQYRRASHGPMYSARIAYWCAFKALPF